MKFKDYYQTLGVSRKDDADAIRKAYRGLARKHHPDFNPGNREAEEKFKDIQEAYAVLSDPEKRREYDQLGTSWKGGSDFTPPPGWRVRTDSGGASVEEVFGEGGGFSDFFQVFFGGRRSAGAATSEPRANPRPADGQDVEAEIELSLEDIHRGAHPTLSIRTPQSCPECGGSGGQTFRRCGRCQGSGVVEHSRKLKVRIPAGTRPGTILKLSGKGGHSGGRAGDLFLRVKAAAHRLFEPLGEDDLQMDLPVTPWEAALGAKIKVPTLDGEVEMTVPAGAQSGGRFRLRGQGLRRRDGGRGDLLVKLKVEIPERLSAEEERLFRELSRVSRFDPRKSL